MSGSYLTVFASVFASLVLGLSSPNPDESNAAPVSGNYSVDYSYADELKLETVPVDTPPPNPYTGPEDPTQWDESNPFNPPLPSNVTVEYELDEEGEGFFVHEKVGGIDVRPPSYITMEEYLELRRDRGMDEYWDNKSQNSTMVQNKGLLPSVPLPNGIKNIFGDGPVEIRPNGSALIDLGAEFNRMMNPSLPLRQQRTGNFRFDQQIQLNVVGKIGSKLRLNANWDTQSTFEFENQINLKYSGSEDEILQLVEAGNVSLPLNGSLINGGQNLFGIKTAFKFGPLTVTTVASQQKGKTQTVTATGGAQVTNFEKKTNEYDEYRHFFLSHYFRSRYEAALANLPVINSNGLQVTRIEVWITNNNSASTTNNRNAVGFIDLGESEVVPNPQFINEKGDVFNPQWAGGGTTAFPDNQANGLYDYINVRPEFSEKATVDSALVNQLNLVQGLDFEKIENMRRLNESEFTFHPNLGYVSLNTALQANQVLYVAYEYMLGGNTYQVGDFSIDPGKQANQLNSNVLFLKMIKPSSVKPVYGANTPPDPYPTWNLMMKNIYSIGGYGIKRDNFKLEIKFDSRSQAGIINYIPEGAVADLPLIQVVELDNLTNNNQSQPDNVFDFIEMITIVPEKGLIIFPVLEPFGSTMARKLNNVAEFVDKYTFPELYTKTRQDAINYFPQKDRYLIKGSYQGSSSSEISLNSINVAPGSVKVTANGIQLTENVDYTVDYNIGKVRILNSGLLTSGQEIKVSFETNSLFGIDSKSLVGARFDYQVNKDILLGGTILHLNERPLTNKIVIGDEPVSNTIYGFDATIRKDSRFITRMIDALPGLQTKEMSTVTFNGEFAQLLPGHPKSIQVGDQKGIGYLEDFESAKTNFDLMGFRAWQIASFPGDNGFNNMAVPAPGWKPTLSTGFSRAKLAWYQIDNTFYSNSGEVFDEEAELNNHYTRQVRPQEVFPNLTTVVGNNQQRTFDLTYSPTKRGPYNFQTDPAKLNPDGTFSNPTENWAGIMRRTGTNTDFEASNFEFMEFWLMDPFIYNQGNDGEMYLDLGRINEDVLRDNFRSFENGLPPDSADLSTIQESDWARVPVTNPPTNAFNNDEEARQFQDVGLDGVWDAEEQRKFGPFLDSLAGVLSPEALAAIADDPSSDNYHYFRGQDLNEANGGNGTSIRDRYLNFNNTDGNTPLNATVDGYNTQGNSAPDTEDMNNNGTLNTTEEYFEYKIRLNPNEMTVGRNYIVDVIPATVTLYNGTTANINWYQFRVPLVAGTPINGIQNFKAIEFVRLYLKGWEEDVTLRFAKFQLVSTSWRTYRDYLGAESDTTSLEPPADLTTFEIGTVNIEENSNRTPFNYVMPPLVVRQQAFGSPQTPQLQNEQSLVLKVCNLQDGDARGAFKLTQFDLRSYVNMRMWVHAEDVEGENAWNDGDLAAFIRLGSDNSLNYYEYEIPLKHSMPNNQDSLNIWKNEFNFDLETLNLVKGIRNDSVWPVTNRFTMPVDAANPDGDRMSVVGTPQLNNIRTLMVGVRNRKNDGQPICAEVWVNELRVTNFNEQAGEAVNARMNVKLADWGNVTLSGSMRTPGFGSLEQKINNRSREETKQFDMAGNFQMGKFLPKKWGIELPVYLTWGQRVVTPQYNPLEGDVPMEALLNSIEDSARRELLRTSVQDFMENKSISFNNIRKVRVAPQAGNGGPPDKGAPGKGGGPNPGPKTHFWDIENFSISYSYAQNFSHNATVQSNLQTTHRGAFTYAYTFTNKPFEPFKKAKKKNILTGFNFNPLPKQIGFSINGDRQFTENIMRPTAGQDSIDPTYFKNFLVTRNYNLRWDFTRGLSFNYTAVNISRVDEPFGRLDTEAKKDSMLNNLLYRGPLTDSSGQFVFGDNHLLNMGRNNSYRQTAGLNVILPFDKYPLTNWIKGNMSYNAGLNWTSAPDNNLSLGNLLTNSQNIQATGTLALGNLYQKVGFLKKLMAPANQPPPPASQSKPGTNPTSKPPAEEAAKDSTDSETKFLEVFGKEVLKILLSVQNIDVTWGRDMTTNIPGYLPATDNFGMDFNYRTPDGTITPVVPPSFGFIAGMQPDLRGNFLTEMANNGWISRDPSLVTNFAQTKSEQLTGRTTVTFFRDFKVNLNITRSYQENFSERFYFDSANTGAYQSENILRTGTYSCSWIFANTAFEKNEDFSQHFLQMQDNDRRIISTRLAALNGENLSTLGLNNEVTSDLYNQGYYRNSQDVLVPAFLSAYSVSKAEKMKLNLFPSIPLPNWSVDYNGLSKLKPFKDVFQSVTLKHSYRGTYSVANFLNNVDYEPGINGLSAQLQSVGIDSISGDSIYNLAPELRIAAVNFTESFGPFCGLNFNMKNGITIGVDYKMNRNVTLNVGPMQLNETRSKDLSLNLAWRKEKLDKQLRLFGRDIMLQNSLNARLEITYRDSKTRNRMLDSEVRPDFTAGNTMFILKPSIDYVVNTKLNLRLYLEHSRNKPAISTSFPSRYTAAGFQIRFTLAN